MSLTNEQGFTTNQLPSNPNLRKSEERKTDLGSSRKSVVSLDYPEEIKGIMERTSKMADEDRMKSVITTLADMYTLEKAYNGQIHSEMNENLLEWSATQTEKSEELTEKTKEAIEKLSAQVNKSSEENRKHLDEALADSRKCRAELRETIESEKDFKSQISKEISGMIITTGSELKATLEEEISAPVNSLKEELDSCKEDVKRQRKRIEHEGRFQFALRLINVVSLISIFFMVLISFFV